MKMLLVAINAKYIHSNLAVYSLKSFAGKYEEDIEICEYTINNYVDDILVDLYKKKPDVMAFSCYIWNIDMVTALVKELKKVMPQVPIWVGGPEVSYEVERFLDENPSVDGIMTGEGEETFLQLMEYYKEEKESLEAISGIVYKKDGVVVKQPRTSYMDLDAVPFPYENLEHFTHRIVYYETSRGCPFSCSYCLSSIEKKVRLRSMELVERELQFFLDRKVPQVKFIDRTFNCNHKHAMAIWSYIKEHDNGVTNFHFEISADLLTEEELELLATMRVGLVQLEIGVQSTNAPTIEAINRTMNLEKLAYAVKKVKKSGNIHQHLDLIAGLPYEDYDTFRISFDQVYALRPDQLQLGFLKVLKGSSMYEKQKKYGILYKDYAPYEVLETEWLPFEKVVLLKQVEEMVEVYYNSMQFTYTLEFLMHEYNSAFDFYQALGRFYARKEQMGVQYTRVARYNMLLSFIEEEKPQLVKPVKELLTYDMYLRENMKTRPGFATNLDVFKNQYYGVYKALQERLEQDTETVLNAYKGYQARQLVRMLHIEYFTYDLNLLIEKGEICEKCSHVLFDYKNPHPLTKEAATYPVSL